MKDHKVELYATEGLFLGLAKQNLKFHQCVGELVDNSIASKPEGDKFRIDIILLDNKDDSVDVYFIDDCRGMTLDILRKSLQPGDPATTENRLNEHGFGMKNSLVTLSGGNGPWRIWTKPIDGDTIFSVEGPFGKDMVIKEGDSFPKNKFLPADISTLIKVKVKKSFLQFMFLLETGKTYT
ncbi:ATP-binding protein [Methanolobus sp. ZRKC3]|uniref:ATP-binding protein n=1 Tax=Methanolobus sp. ZRKC3 TaxID=3125786 RepID=UPI00324D3D9A